MNESEPNQFPEANQLPSHTVEVHIGVEPNRRLISPEVAQTEHVEEYIDSVSRERLIALDESDESVALHQHLARRGVPVFPVVRAEQGKILLDVPAEARTVLGSMRFFSRDVIGYAPTFRQLGDLMARLQATGFGLPVATRSRTVLEGLAVAADENRYGSGLTLVPPYEFNRLGTKRELLETLGGEVIASGYFTPAQRDFLLRQVDGGWDEFRH
jgi:hypothetical protein